MMLSARSASRALRYGHTIAAKHLSHGTIRLPPLLQSYPPLSIDPNCVGNVRRFGTGRHRGSSGAAEGDAPLMATKRHAARSRLGLPAKGDITYAELRSAYFDCAKRCHPDSTDDRGRNSSRGDLAARFLLVTEAYELLLSHAGKGQSNNYELTLDDEMAYRRDCQSWLGTSAELVEEMKSDSMFRQWLQGKTDAAFHWRNFLTFNGGLAPRKLRHRLESGGIGGGGDNGAVGGKKGKERRRRRPKR